METLLQEQKTFHEDIFPQAEFFFLFILIFSQF